MSIWLFPRKYFSPYFLHKFDVDPVVSNCCIGKRKEVENSTSLILCAYITVVIQAGAGEMLLLVVCFRNENVVLTAAGKRSELIRLLEEVGRTVVVASRAVIEILELVHVISLPVVTLTLLSVAVVLALAMCAMTTGETIVTRLLALPNGYSVNDKSVGLGSAVLLCHEISPFRLVSWSD